jgi:hypothetical protein
MMREPESEDRGRRLTAFREERLHMEHEKPPAERLETRYTGRISRRGLCVIPYPFRQRWAIEGGSFVDVVDVETTVLVLPGGGREVLLDYLFPRELLERSPSVQ